MLMEGTKERYFYNAHGHALSGQIDRPFKHTIEVQAGTTLPTAGGYGSSRVCDFRLKEIASFKAAYTHVSGSLDEKSSSHTTLVSSAVEGLNILDLVTADRVVARASSQWTSGDKEPQITFLGSQVENLRIAGHRVDVELDGDLCLRLDTFASLTKEFETNANFRKIAEDPFQTGQPQKFPGANGVLLCSLVRDMKTTCPGIKRQGHAFIVPQCGKIFLGEVLAEHGKRTLTMVRMELGSPVCGQIICTAVIASGHHWP
jgi:hypothetical protein